MLAIVQILILFTENKSFGHFLPGLNVERFIGGSKEIPIDMV